MTSKSILFNDHANAGFKGETTATRSAFLRFAHRLIGKFQHSELEKIQAANRRKQKAAQASRQDMHSSLSLNDKMRLGMHHWID